MTTIQGAVSSDLNAAESVSWFTSSFLISVTAVMPLAGRLSQIVTARVYVLGSVCVQCVGLVIISISNSFHVFILGRVVCGIGAAAVTPVAFLLVNDLTDPKNRGVFFGCINTAFTSGVACGAIFAGLLEPRVGWRAVFALQVPICLCAAMGAFLSIPKPNPPATDSSDGKQAPQTVLTRLLTLDFPGITTLITSVVLLLYSLSSPHISITAIILSLIFLASFILIEARYATDPIIPISVLRHRGNLFTGLATVGLMAARWSVLFYTPIYAIAVRGWSPAKAGVLLIPTDLGFAMGGIVVGAVHIRGNRSYYVASLVTFGLFAVDQFSLSRFSTPGSSLVGMYIPASFMNGFCAGAILNYTLAHVLFLTPGSAHVVVIPFIAMLRSLAGSFGSAIAGGVFLRSLTSGLRDGFEEMVPGLGEVRREELIRRLVGGPELVYKLARGEEGGADARELFEVALGAYVTAFRTMFLWGTGIVCAMVFLQAGTGWTGAGEQNGEDGDGGKADLQDEDGDTLDRYTDREDTEANGAAVRHAEESDERR